MKRIPLLPLILFVGVLGAILSYQRPSDTGTATIADGVAPSLSVLPVEETFSEARPIEWDGMIIRVFVGGEGLEIKSIQAPGGVFQAYMSAGQTSPVIEGPVRVQGLWRGYTCAYGGHGGECVPEVDIQSIQVQPIELQ